MSPITVHIKSGQNNWSVEIDNTASISEFKEAISVVSSIPADNQRLIYSGKILKDAETVESYKIQDGHSVHMVKSGGGGGGGGNAGAKAPAAAAAAAAGSAAGAPAEAVPSNIAAGQTGGYNPLADLTSARYAGLHNLPSADMFGPDGGLNRSQSAQNQDMMEMMESPLFQSQMQEMLGNPQMVDFLIQQNPQLRAMGPHARQMLSSPMFRQMMSDPRTIRESMQMMNSMNDAGLDPSSAFPAPGSATSGAAGAGAGVGAGAGAGAGAGTGAGAGAAANPFASLFGGGHQPQFNPELLASMLGTNSTPASAAPADTRPPEERYESQLRQLNDMGFFDFDRNVAALRRSGGSVQGALDALLNGSV